MLLGCIADDFTGATDLANMLVRGGMRTVQTIGVPGGTAGIDADAVVVALKSRTTPAADAVAESLAACRWLKAAGARQIFFKYCSTFDSTERGNIGPVADALMKELGTDLTIACPAFPENGRSVYRGYLFVGDVLLNESGMEKHPLTPMTDANLVRVLQSQSHGKVGLARCDTVAKGPQALRERFAGGAGWSAAIPGDGRLLSGRHPSPGSSGTPAAPRRPRPPRSCRAPARTACAPAPPPASRRSA